MSEYRPQNQNQQFDNEEPRIWEGSADPADFEAVIDNLPEFDAQEQARTVSEPAESAVDSTDKGLGKSGRQAQTSELKPEEDVDAAREAVEKSLKSEEEVAEEPTAQQRAAASTKISETAEAAARPVKKRRSSQDRSSRVSSESRDAVDRARAEGEAKRAAKAKETEAPQTPPIMGERDGANEKPAKQTVVTEGTDGQEYVTEPTTERPKQARVPKEAATEARPVPEAVIPTQEQPEPATPAEEPKTVLSGTIIPPKISSQEEYDADIKSMAATIGYDQEAHDDLRKRENAKASDFAREERKAEPRAEQATTTAREEQLDEDVLAAMGGADTGRPAKKRDRNKARREETAEASTEEAAAPAEPISESEAPRRPSPADMPGARGRRNGPTPADMPRRRPASHSVNEQAPAPQEPAPEAEKPAVEPEEDILKTERFETKTNENVAIAGISIEAAYRKDPVAHFGEKYRDIVGNNNEDSAIVNAELSLGAVFDGAGGNGGKDAGLKASRAAAAAVEEVWTNNEGTITRVPEALNVMRDAVAEARYKIHSDPENDGVTMGTIGKIMELEGKHQLVYAQIGDTRMVVYNPDTQEIIFQTQEQQAPNGQPYNAITGKDTKRYFFDGPEISHYDVYGTYELPENARILICSDGITGAGKTALTDAELLQVFKDNENATQAELAQAFVNASKKIDDKTVVIMDFHAKEATTETTEEKPSDDDILASLDFAAPEDLEAEVLKTARNRDTRTPEEVKADDEAAAAARTAEIDADPMGSMRNSARNRLGGFGNRSRDLGSTALGGEDTSWANSLFDEVDDLDEEGEPDPFAYLYGDTDTAPDDHDDDYDNDDDDNEASRSLTDDLLGDFGDPEPTRRTRRERVGAAFRTGWDKARTYFTGRDLDHSAPDRDRRIAGRQLKVMAGALGATVLAGALFSGLAGDTGNEGPTHVGKGPSASAEKTPGAKVDSGKTEAKPSESATGSDKKESKKPSATVDDDHRYEHGTGSGNVSHTFDVGRETVKVSADNEVVVTLKQGGTVWDALDKIGDELHINHSDEDIAETVQSMHLKPGQDRQMKVGSSYTFKVQGGKLVAKK